MTTHQVTAFVVQLLVAALVAVLLAPTHAQSPSSSKLYCGVALGTGLEAWQYRTSKFGAVLRQLKQQDGANYAQVSAYLMQVGGANSTRTRPVTDDASVRLAIRRSKAAGLKVFLKPVVTVEATDGSFVWRGFIPGTAEWFDKVHTPWIIRMATLAQKEGVDILSVGSEYVATQSSVNLWYDTIRQVRAIFKGKLTYIANHDSYQLCRFFPRLDFISISAYFRLRNTPAGPYPDLEATKTLYEIETQKIEAWRNIRGLTAKKVLFAEFGIQSKGDGVAYYEPWEWTANASLSLTDQVKMYEAFFSTFMPKSWSLGVMLWYYELTLNAGKSGESRLGYTPQNKPAQQVLRDYFQRYC